jgi:RTX calcium-binding nonapeptide repeat (4 copies)
MNGVQSTRRISLAAIAVVSIASVVAFPRPANAQQDCRFVGQFGSQYDYVGSSGNDVCDFTGNRSQHVELRAGADKSYLGPLDDHGDGEVGDDLLQGAGGWDSLYGGPGDDRLSGGTGVDILRDNFDGGDFDRVCDGDGGDWIFLRDGDGQDIWYSKDDGVSESDIELDPGDEVRHSDCPFSS